MTNFPIALAAGFAVLLIIVMIGVRSASRARKNTTDGSGDAAAWPIQGLIKHFRPEMERRMAERNGAFSEAAE